MAQEEFVAHVAKLFASQKWRRCLAAHLLWDTVKNGVTFYTRLEQLLTYAVIAQHVRVCRDTDPPTVRLNEHLSFTVELLDDDVKKKLLAPRALETRALPTVDAYSHGSRNELDGKITPILERADIVPELLITWCMLDITACKTEAEKAAHLEKRKNIAKFAIARIPSRRRQIFAQRVLGVVTYDPKRPMATCWTTPSRDRCDAWTWRAFTDASSGVPLEWTPWNEIFRRNCRRVANAYAQVQRARRIARNFPEGRLAEPISLAYFAQQDDSFESPPEYSRVVRTIRDAPFVDEDYKIAGTLDSHTRYAGARREPFVESTLDEARAGCSFEPYKQWLSVFSKKHPYARVVCFDSVRVHPFEGLKTWCVMSSSAWWMLAKYKKPHGVYSDSEVCRTLFGDVLGTAKLIEAVRRKRKVSPQSDNHYHNAQIVRDALDLPFANGDLNAVAFENALCSSKKFATPQQFLMDVKTCASEGAAPPSTFQNVVLQGFLHLLTLNDTDRSLVLEMSERSAFLARHLARTPNDAGIFLEVINQGEHL